MTGSTATETPARLFTGERVLGLRKVPGERAADAGQVYALSTETYVPQDGWVLIAAGARMYADTLPALWSHDRRELPVGKWIRFGPVGTEVQAEIDWLEENPKTRIVKSMAANEIGSVSVSFRVAEWHVPDEKERTKFGIPRDDPFAGIATRWFATEASFVNIPADPTVGKRTVGELAIERGFVTAADWKEHMRSRDERRIDELFDRIAASDAAMVEKLNKIDEAVRSLQRTADAIREKVFVASDVRTDTKKNATERGPLYNLQTLGMTVSAAVEKVARSKVVESHAAGSHAGADRGTGQ